MAERQPRSGDEHTDTITRFEWSDSIVGMGYFPSEVSLHPEWRWSVDGAPQAATAPAQ